MAKRILDTRDWVEISDFSYYNHNYYKNIHTNEIILEEGDDDHAFDFFEANEVQMKNKQHGNYIGCCWMEDFDIPNQYAREHGVANEYVYEFDSTIC